MLTITPLTRRAQLGDHGLSPASGSLRLAGNTRKMQPIYYNMYLLSDKLTFVICHLKWRPLFPALSVEFL